MQEKIESKPENEKQPYEKAIEQITNSDEYSSLINRAQRFEKSNIQEAEETYKEIVKKYPSNTYALGRCAQFLTSSVRKFKEAENYFLTCLKADPTGTHVIDYAYFLAVIKNDIPKAQDLLENVYRRTTSGHAITSYAILLDRFVCDYDYAEKLYKEALKTGDENSYGNYASFLIRRRNEYEKAQSLYETAISIHDHMSIHLMYADALLSIGNPEGLKILNKVHSVVDKQIRIVFDMIKYTYLKDANKRKISLKSIKRLSSRGFSGYGYFPSDLEFALKTHHNPALLKTLHNVLFHGASISKLSKYPEWEKTNLIKNN